jgi:hypothetical protein
VRLLGVERLLNFEVTFICSLSVQVQYLPDTQPSSESQAAWVSSLVI